MRGRWVGMKSDRHAVKIRVECRATVMVDVSVTEDQLRELEAGTLELDDVVDPSIPYRALATSGELECVDWDRAQPERGESSLGSSAGGDE